MKDSSEASEQKAINGKQIKLTFNKTVDVKSAENKDNYKVLRNSDTTAVALSDASLTSNVDSIEADGKTVVITFANDTLTDLSVSKDTLFKFTVDGVKDKAGNAVEKSTTNLSVNDTTAPEFVSAKASAKTATSDVTLTFSEPVDTTQALVSINGTYATFVPGDKPNEVVATFTGEDLEAGKSYDVTILNVKDAAGNLIANNNQKVSLTVTADATAPAITDVKAVRDNLVEVTFDKAINLASVTGNATAIKFVDGNLNSLGTVDYANATIKADTNGKTLLVPFSAVTLKDGKATGNLVFTDVITDKSGNKLAATSKSLTVNEDVAAPTVVSAKYVNKETYGDQTGLTYGAIVVKFSEEVTKSAAETAYTVVDNKGAVVATAFTNALAINGDDKTELVLPLTAAVGSTDITSYKVVLPASAVVDNSLGANASKTANLTVDVSAGAVVANDTQAPTATVAETAATTSISGTTIDVTYNEAMNAATVIDTNNYRLNGLPLAAGSYITLSGNVATINIPAGSIAKDATNYSLNITGVKDKAGNAINASTAVYTGLTLNDDIAPELKTAVLNAGGTVTLGFSEDLAAAPDKADFEVFVDGTKLATTDYSIAAGTGTDAGKYILTVTGVDLSKATTSSVTVQAKSATTTVDDTNIGNLLADSKVIKVK